MNYCRSAILVCVSVLFLFVFASQPGVLAQEQILPGAVIVRSQPTRVGQGPLDRGNQAVALLTLRETTLEDGVLLLPGMPFPPGSLVLSGELRNVGAARVFLSSASPRVQAWLEPGGTLIVDPLEGAEPQQHRLSCTCKCGSGYVAADDSAKPCKDLEGSECITAGKKHEFEDCGMRYIDVSSSSSLMLELGRREGR